MEKLRKLSNFSTVGHHSQPHFCSLCSNIYTGHSCTWGPTRCFAGTRRQPASFGPFGGACQFNAALLAGLGGTTRAKNDKFPVKQYLNSSKTGQSQKKLRERERSSIYGNPIWLFRFFGVVWALLRSAIAVFQQKCSWIRKDGNEKKIHRSTVSDRGQVGSAYTEIAAYHLLPEPFHLALITWSAVHVNEGTSILFLMKTKS